MYVTSACVPCTPLPLLCVLTCCVGQEKRVEASKLRVSMKLAISDGESAVKQRLMSKNTRKGLPLQGAATKRHVTSSQLLAQQQDQDTPHKGGHTPDTFCVGLMVSAFLIVQNSHIA